MKNIKTENNRSWQVLKILSSTSKISSIKIPQSKFKLPKLNFANRGLLGKLIGYEPH